jgi:hypothetical protein
MSRHFTVLSLSFRIHLEYNPQNISVIFCLLKRRLLIVKYKISEVYVESKNILGGWFRLFIITLDTYLINDVYKTQSVHISPHKFLYKYKYT